jgi:hypothetical protein
MDPAVLALGAVVVGGLTTGFLARPLTWRLVVTVLVFGAAFLGFGLVRASWHEGTVASVLGLLVFSGGSGAGREIGAIAISYAAFLAAAIMSFRLRAASKASRHEP